jgi:cation diffusion facilitator family transporter
MKTSPAAQEVQGKALHLPAWLLVASFAIMAVKFLAYGVTDSHAILSDALESIVNVVAGSFALYSLWWSMQPRDQNHPYGHGKIEFLSAGIEGGLIVMAGLGIVYEAVGGLLNPTPLKNLNTGVILVSVAGLANAFLGWALLRHGKKLHSSALEADGHHLLSDAYTSVGMLLGLGVAWWTGLQWLDSALAIGFAGLLLYTGHRLVKRALAGLLDAADMEILPKVISTLSDHRHPHRRPPDFAVVPAFGTSPRGSDGFRSRGNRAFPRQVGVICARGPLYPNLVRHLLSGMRAPVASF